MPGQSQWPQWGRWDFWGGGGDLSLGDFTQGDNAFIDEFKYAQLNCENLLKAPDDLTNGSYWSFGGGAGVTPTDEGDGVFRLTKIAAASKAISQNLINWFPPWAGCISVVFEVRSGTLDSFTAAFDTQLGAIVDDVEKISGTGTATLTNGRLITTGLDSGWSKFRASGSVKGFSSIQLNLYPDLLNADAGYLEVRNVQVILGDQPSEKPRPVGQETDYPMMAYRPNWRPTLDGSARCSVVDTGGLLWCGEMTDGLIAPSTATAITHPADTRITFSFTFEDGNDLFIKARWVDGGKHVRIRCRGDNGNFLLDVIDDVGGNQNLLNESALFNDGEFYRGVLDLYGDTAKLYMDDKLWYNGHAGGVFLTQPDGFVDHALASNDIKLTTETNPKRPGLIIAGGKATPEDGDPGIWHTQPDGSAFTVGASHAALITATTHVAAKEVRFGLDSGVSGLPLAPRSRLTSDLLSAEYGGSNNTPQTWTAGTELSFMQMLRSDTHGSHFLLHESGKQWKLFNANADAIPAASAYPAVANYDAMLSLSRIALLDLSSWVPGGGDFAEELDNAASPSDGVKATFDARTGQLMVEVDITRPDPITGHNIVRLLDAGDNPLFHVGAGSASDTLHLYDATIPANIIAAASKLPAGTTINVKLTVDRDGAAKVYADNVLAGSATLAAEAVAAIAKVESGFGGAGETQADRILTPFPALGLADDRIVAPQDDDTFIHSDDFFAILRNVVLPSGTNNQWWFRTVDSDDTLQFYLTPDGTTQLYKVVGGAPTALISVGAGTTADGDDDAIVVGGVNSEVFVNGASIGSSALTEPTAGAAGQVDRIVDGGSDSLELWKLIYKLPFGL